VLVGSAVSVELIEDLDNTTYQAHPALSQSGAKLLLPPSCPAKFRYRMDHPPQAKPHFTFGHAAHRLVLGKGAEIVEVEADNWLTKAAKAQRDEALAAGLLPLLTEDVAKAHSLADAVRAHPLAGRLFAAGRAEQSVLWRDEQYGVDRRARFDWVPEERINGRLFLPDLKTTSSAEPGKFAKSLADFAYHQQASWYRDAAIAAALNDDPVFLLVAVEQEPPHVITVFLPDAEALAIATDLNALAMKIYKRCLVTDTWPGYSDSVVSLSLPRWYVKQTEEMLDNDNS